jgi:hypothetical protein
MAADTFGVLVLSLGRQVAAAINLMNVATLVLATTSPGTTSHSATPPSCSRLSCERLRVIEWLASKLASG